MKNEDWKPTIFFEGKEVPIDEVEDTIKDFNVTQGDICDKTTIDLIDAVSCLNNQLTDRTKTIETWEAKERLNEPLRQYLLKNYKDQILLGDYITPKALDVIKDLEEEFAETEFARQEVVRKVDKIIHYMEASGMDKTHTYLFDIVMGD